MSESSWSNPSALYTTPDRATFLTKNSPLWFHSRHVRYGHMSKPESAGFWLLAILVAPANGVPPQMPCGSSALVKKPFDVKSHLYGTDTTALPFDCSS